MRGELHALENVLSSSLVNTCARLQVGVTLEKVGDSNSFWWGWRSRGRLRLESACLATMGMAVVGHDCIVVCFRRRGLKRGSVESFGLWRSRRISLGLHELAMELVDDARLWLTCC